MQTLGLPGGGVVILSAEPPQQSLAEVIGARFGQGFTWVGRNGDTFTWSIDLAQRIIGDREPTTEITLEDQVQAMLCNSCRDELNLEHAMTTDLSKPLIAIEHPVESVEGAIVMLFIDGWHRMAKSILTQNRTPLKVHVLTREEERACRVERNR